MIEFIVAVDPRPNTKARHFVSVAQALDRGLVRPCCHARKRDRFSAHRKPQKVLDRLGLLRHVAPPFTHFFPRRAFFLPPGEPAPPNRYDGSTAMHLDELMGEHETERL